MLKNKILVSSLLVAGFLWSFSFASSSLETLTNLSNQAIAHSSNKEKTISVLKSIFTSCVQTNTNVDTRQSCQNLLNSSNFVASNKTDMLSRKWSTIANQQKCFSFKVQNTAKKLSTIYWWDDSSSPFSGQEDLINWLSKNLDMTACHTYTKNTVATVQVDQAQIVTDLDLRSGLLPRYWSGIIVSRDLSKWSNLKSLTLGGNEIKQLDNNSFNGLSSLELLYLGENQISSIAAHTFDSLKNLKTLNLRKNNLSQFDSNRLKNLSNLEYLSLAENKIKSIDKKAFVWLKNLNYLDIGANPFGKLDIKYFQGLSNLSQKGDLPSFRS